MGTPEKPLVFRFRHTVVKGFVWVCWTISLMLWALFDRSHPLAPLVGSLSFAAFAIAGMFARRNARLEFDGQAFSVYDWSGKVEATVPASEVGRCSIRLQTNERGNPNGYLMDCPSARIEVPLTTSNLSRLLDKVRELSGRDLPWTEIPTAGEIAGSFSPRQMLVKQLNSRAFTTFGTAAGIMLAEVIGGKAHWDMRTLSWVLFPSLVYMLIARVRRANERLVIDEDGVRYVNPFGFATFRVAWQDIEPGTMSWSFDEIDSAFYAVYRVRINGRVIRWDTAMPNCEKLCIRVRRFAQQPWLPLPQDSIPGFGGADGRTVTA